jgi:hypothetical protein
MWEKMSDNAPMDTWLSEYTNKVTRNNNEANFKVFLIWVKKTPKQLIDEFEQVKTKSQILQFQSYLINEYISPHTNDKLKPNSVRSILTSVRAFYTSQKEMVRGLKSKIIDIESAKGEHIFSLEDLRAMYAVGDLRDKAILATSTSLGWEISAFLNLEKDFVESLVKRARSQNVEFIAFDWQRKKTGATQYGILNPMAIFSLEQYLAKLNKENPKAKRLFELTEVSINNIMRKLTQDANLALIGTIRFHLLRKYLMNALSDAGLNSFEVKLILGKEIGIADATYLQTLKKSAFEKYQKAYPTHLSLSQNVNGAAKYNILVDLVTQHVKSQQKLIEYMKSNGMLKTVPQPIQDELNSVYEFAKLMEKQNGKKTEGEQQKEGEPQKTDSDRVKVDID